MKLIFAPKNLCLIMATSLSLFLFISCQKELSEGPLTPVVTTPVDLSTRVTSSVSGFITNENDEAVQAATVKVGNQTIVTDEYGYFEAKNVQVVKNAATVTVSNPNYFPGVRTYIAEANKAAFVRIKLIPKTLAGSFVGSAGGAVTLTNGLKVSLPANAVVNALTGAAYTGNVNVAAAWLDPTAADLARIMPGDLRALDTSGALKQLITYGMTAVELTGGGGEKLQVAPGKKAGLSFPLPSTLAASAPATIPLWYFDENIGLWKEEGTATKTGNTYEAQVTHFSFWNCDVPANFVQVNMTVKDHNGKPLPYAYVRISKVSNPESWASGYTDSSGFVAGAIPANAQLKLEVFAAYACGAPIHNQNFASAGANMSLGIISVNTLANLATLTGTVTNCNGVAVTNGYVMMKKDNQYYRYSLSNTGSFNFTTILCNTTGTVVQVFAEDVMALQQSTASTHTLAAGNNNLGNLVACGLTTQQFFNISINGTTYNYTPPADSLRFLPQSGSSAGLFYMNALRLAPPNQFVTILLNGQGIGVGSSQPITLLTTNLINDSTTVTAPINISITEYGSIGQFISGNFTGAFRGSAPANTIYNVNLTFRIRRYF